MKHADAIIIGAGPAGAIAAHTLASQGIAVALIDKETFPRDKICGDGLAGEGLLSLERIGLGGWTKTFPTFTTLRLSSPEGRLVDILVIPPEGDCYGRTIPRVLLDAELVRVAAGAGANLYEGTTVTGIEIEEKAVLARTDKGSFSASILILAEGSHAHLARKLGLSASLPEMIAIRQYRTGDPGPYNRIEIHFQDLITPGYNWLFPLLDGGVNVGSFTYTQRVKRREVDLKRSLDRFLHDSHVVGGRLIPTEAVSKPQAFPLRTRFGATRTHSERVLVAGDAAETISPLSGEGIAPAMLSGEIAASHALKALQHGDFSARSLSTYSTALQKHFARDYRHAAILRKALRIPWLLNRVFRNMDRDPDLALLVGAIIIGQHPPGMALKPVSLMKLLK